MTKTLRKLDADGAGISLAQFVTVFERQARFQQEQARKGASRATHSHVHVNNESHATVKEALETLRWQAPSRQESSDLLKGAQA